MAWAHEIHGLHSLLRAQAVTHRSFTQHQRLHYLVYSPRLLPAAWLLLWARLHVRWPHCAWQSCFPWRAPLTYPNDDDDRQLLNLHLVTLLIRVLLLFPLIHHHFIVLLSSNILRIFSSFLAHLIHFIPLHGLHLAAQYYLAFINFLASSWLTTFIDDIFFALFYQVHFPIDQFSLFTLLWFSVFRLKFISIFRFLIYNDLAAFFNFLLKFW